MVFLTLIYRFDLSVSEQMLKYNYFLKFATSDIWLKFRRVQFLTNAFACCQNKRLRFQYSSLPQRIKPSSDETLESPFHIHVLKFSFQLMLDRLLLFEVKLATFHSKIE